MDEIFVSPPHAVVYQTDDLYNMDIERYEPFYGLDSHFLADQRKLRHNLMRLLFEKNDRSLRLHCEDDEEAQAKAEQSEQQQQQQRPFLTAAGLTDTRQPKVLIERPTCSRCDREFAHLNDLRHHLRSSAACAKAAAAAATATSNTKNSRYF